MKIKTTESGKGTNLTTQIVHSLTVAAIDSIANSTIELLKSVVVSSIDVGEFYHDSYNEVNRILYQLNPRMYEKHRLPVTNKDWFELNTDIQYFIKLKKKNYIRVSTYKENHTNGNMSEKRVRVTFYGPDKYKYRNKFRKKLSIFASDDKIKLCYLDDWGIMCSILPHSFDNIVLPTETKDKLVNGLTSWNNSRQWYHEHQLVHKIGVLLYGKPGTGKSTIARAISTMFNNAPILVVKPNSIMTSIREILHMRSRYDGTFVVLIEDFDMYCKSREDNGEPINTELESDDNQMDKKAVVTTTSSESNCHENVNQNAIFQLLDGVYSTDNTIYVATTNYIERLDPAIVRYGRFDIQTELEYFSKEECVQFAELLGYSEDIVDKMDITFPAQPSYVQSEIMRLRSIEEVR